MVAITMVKITGSSGVLIRVAGRTPRAGAALHRRTPFHRECVPARRTGFPSDNEERDVILQLDEAAVRAVLRWDELIAAMERALADFSAGRVLQPVRTMLAIEDGKRYLGIMPAVTGVAMGAKLVSFYPGNAGSELPTHMATIVLLRPQTGEPLAVMDGRLITEMRTAAVSAAVTRRLASPESRVLALLGSGVQAEAHLAALGRVRSFAEVRVWSRTPEHARRFAAAHGATASADPESAVRGADVIVTPPARISRSCAARG
jgi:thiomorpholine-carboxylate dehydrogenase